jgi:hypothetical protein
MKLDPVSVSFLRVLLDQAEQYRFKSRRRYDPARLNKALLTYKQLIQLAGYKTRGIGGVPFRKAGQHLGPIAELCLSKRLPCLNTLVVNGKTREPGDAVLMNKATPHWTTEATACLYVKYPAADLLSEAGVGAGRSV